MRKSAFTALVAVLALAGCAAPTGPSGPDTAAGSAIAAEFNPTDRDWLELMIPMDEQLLPALDLAATHSTNPGLRAMAADFAASVHIELDQLRELGGLAGLPADNPHAGHRMPGLVDADTLAALRQSAPAAFDPALLGVVRDNISQATTLAGSEQKAGAQPRTTALAASVVTVRAARQAELATLTVHNG